jgi:hypothetical protein
LNLFAGYLNPPRRNAKRRLALYGRDKRSTIFLCGNGNRFDAGVVVTYRLFSLCYKGIIPREIAYSQVSMERGDRDHTRQRGD